MDKHVLVHKSEIEDIINTLKIFKNVDLIVSEYAFDTKYSYEKEIVIEAITLFSIVKTMDVSYAERILEILEKNLNNNISNLTDILELEEFKLIKN